MIKSQALGGRSNKALMLLGLFLGLVSAVLGGVYLKSAGGGEGEDTAPAVGEGAEANPEATTVTLAVSPAHGEVLTVAEACAEPRLALALRAFGGSSTGGARRGGA